MTHRHIIKKQILDLTLDSPVGSFTFQSEVGRLYKQEIVPLVDRCCSAIDTGDGVIRIDKLEVDLGRIARQDFGRKFKRQVALLLPRQLEKAVQVSLNHELSEGGSQPQRFFSSEADRDFEVLAFFIYEGCLPWWVKSDEAYQMPVLLEQTIARQPDKVKKLIAEIIANAALVRRLLDHATDELILRIVALYQPEYYQKSAKLAQTLITGLAGCKLLKSAGLAKVRPEVWRCLLLQVTVADGAEFDPQLLVKMVVRQLAQIYKVEERRLYHQLVTDLEARGSRLPVEMLEESRLIKQAALMAQPLAAVEQLLKELQNFNGNERQLQQSVAKLAAIQKMLQELAASGGGEQSTAPLTSLVQYLGKQLKSWLLMGSKTGVASPETDELQAVLQKCQCELAALFQPKENETGRYFASEKPNIVPSPGSFEAENAFGISEEIYVGNAGLVLLWPYLCRFFGELGLVSERRFIDDAAAERAVLLLHYLASGTDRVQEYELALNKVMCGIDAVAPVKPDWEITEFEKAECEGLLKAVILNWPAIRNVSLPGLRSMFLRREGFIFTRDGQRVLRIAGAPYDILVNQIPWGIGTVRLPWMEQLLMVEWGV